MRRSLQDRPIAFHGSAAAPAILAKRFRLLPDMLVARNVLRQPALPIQPQRRGGFEMKGIVLWLMGVPLIAIILLYMFVF
ncbi:hypothetical protein B0E45_17850 [Sinorhizobium sp. A49]|uniref:hypothetical protein n=1 Tax=Sinorhizobium sp. A49 TaxID=1945861 RepID=UPI0009CB20D7|nr:hypothetical protein [Sinorhizobium sp. A49]OOG68192.1 hypothetical protein B0E45_17850 [Sinorhizobium sp. A49]